MSTFSYRARDNMGNLVKGAIEAFSQEEVAQKLQQMEYVPITITEIFTSLKLDKITWKFKRIKTEDIVIFNIQFANMLSAGLGIITALEILQKQCANKKLSEIIGSISRGVEAGESLSQALAKQPRIFPNIYISMVKAAEASGDLSKVLNRYAEFAEAQAELTRKIKEA